MPDEDAARPLQQEIGLLRARVAQREEALARLTSRLLELERGQGNVDADRLLEAEQRAAAATAEVQRLRATKTFRWTATARGAWSAALRTRARLSGR